MSGYSTRQAAELIGLTTDQVRHYVRRNLVQPGRGPRGDFRFTFQDVVLLRTAKGLLDASVSARKTYRALVKLKKELAQDHSLSAMRIYADGSSVMVQDEQRVWEVETGQGQFNFEAAPANKAKFTPPTENVAQIAQNVAEIADHHVRLAERADDLDTDEWYNLGLDLEELEPEKAPEAYRQAIRLDPKNADAHVNLGRLFQLNGDLKRAKRHYELALTARPAHELANYNLGTIFDELDETHKAADFYENAPGIPDAHYNLARIRELQGDEINARRHMRKYRDLLDEEVSD